MELTLLLLIINVLLINCQSLPTSFRYGDFFPRKTNSDAQNSEILISGAIRDVIKRNSPGFRKILVRNSEPNINFQTEDSRLMTSRAKQKIDALASLVTSRFDKNIKVVVLKAWTDVVEKEDKVSLHYEGRAFLIRASNNNKTLLSNLMVLAIEAGFDWVYYKYEDSIYLSVIPDVCQTKLDLSIIVDTSGSIGIVNFNKVKTFLTNLIDFFNVGLDETRIALVSYSFRVFVEFRLNEKQDKPAIKEAISKIRYQRSITATGDALMTLVEVIYTEENGMRSDKSIPKIGVLLTDGYSNDGIDVYYAAERVKQAGISMFVIGVSDSVIMTEILAIASPPVNQHYIAIDSFTNLTSFLDQITAVSCDEGALLSKCDNAETAVDGGSFKYFQTKFTGNNHRINQHVSVKLVDKQGMSFIYVSTKLQNPGPLSEEKDVNKSESNISPRIISIDLPSSGESIIYIAVQGQEDYNVFDLSIWESLFSTDQISVNISENENVGQQVFVVQTISNPKSFNYMIKDGLNSGDFQIDDNGQITTNKSLDRESIPSYKLSVIAEDKNDKCHKGLISIVINVDDKNDNKPEFEKREYKVELREDTPLNQFVIQVQATDKDIGKNAELTYELSGSSQDVFKIEKKTGVIKTNKTLDYESKSSYTIELVVRDSGANILVGNACLIVTVTDVNEPPEFVNCQIPRQHCLFIIDENKPENTTVTKRLIAKDPDTTPCSLSYSIVSLDRQYFKVTGNTIQTRMSLDREAKKRYSLEVSVKDCGTPPLHAFTIITVVLNDLNDNNPKFTESFYKCFAKEDLPKNATLCAVSANDIDAGINAKIIFSISSSNEGIHINSNNGILSLDNNLDRETKPVIELVITATDQGKPSLHSSVNLTIVVVDVNDNAPTFIGNRNLSIDENVKTRTVVTKLEAVDIDEGLNAQVRFLIISGNTDDMFTINNQGELVTQKQPDREKIDFYSLNITVHDLGDPSLSNTAVYTIQINDLNDNSPIFDRSLYILTVKENQLLNTIITKVTATDIDIGNNKEITYRILDGNEENIFSLDPNIGSLTLIATLKFRKQKKYNLNVAATDKGSPSRSSETFIEITVEDTNDFAPIFIDQPYVKSLNENVEIGTDALLIKAKDNDFGPSGDLTFSIESLQGLPFTINSKTGLITTKGFIDYEVTQSFSFTVYVQDGGAPSLKANASVFIQIVDLNDNAPIMVNQTIYVVENEVKEKTIFVLNGVDKDSGSNSIIDYSLMDSKLPFKIQHDQLKVNGILDRENISKYSFEISLTDRGIPPQKSISTIIIIINDENDNGPKFRKSLYDCSVRENSPVGTFVCSVDASDVDAGENATLSFFIFSALLKIDQISGEIRTNSLIDREVLNNITTTIQVKDNGKKQRESKALLSVTILDENDNKPKFDFISYNFSFVEEQNAGTEVGKVFVTDEDMGSNKEIVFDVIHTDRFWIDSLDNGIGIIKAKKLNREERDLYKFIVRAFDKGTPSLSSWVNVVVTITDINDNVPLIEEKKYQRSIKETVSFGTFVLKITASDLDIGKNGQFVYKIKSSLNSHNFFINSSTGVIMTAAALDYETVPSYILNIETIDQGSPPLSDSAVVNISIINEDNTPPKFEQVKGVSIYEDLGVNQPVMQFNASDVDNSNFTYKIVGGINKDTFQINKVTGLLFLKKNIDHERKDFYNISIEASDARKKEVIYLPVDVIDVNDNYPIFNQASYSGNVEEESDDFTRVIVTVIASDKDSNLNAEIEYKIVSGNNSVFEIDSKLGILHSKKKLDREETETYIIEVAAVDKGTPSLCTSVFITINVADINDNYPKFENAVYNISVKENLGAGLFLIQLRAFDVDKNENGTVVYSISAEFKSLFSINESTGLLYALINFDREEKDSYTIKVKAFDRGIPSKSSETLVNIIVLDENDNPPVIQTKTLPAINESVSIGTNLFQILADDSDIGINKVLVFSITPDIFRIDSNGNIFLNGPLDRELVSQHNVLVKVEDTGSPRLQTSMSYIIDVTDDNDNAPVFLNTPYYVDLEENFQSKNLLLKAHANDIDIGINSQIAYSILNDNEIFSINAFTGDIYSMKAVDYETIKSFVLNISASDWKFTTFVTVVVTVVNLNDNYPQFEMAEYFASILENATINSLVVNVNANDLDPFGKLSYILSNTTDLPFKIESETGSIKVSDNLDREKIGCYSFKVIVFDSGNPKLYNESNIVVKILDVNDNRPKFKSNLEIISLKENKPVGTSISLLSSTAFDEDIEENAILRYEAVQSSDDLCIDNVTGEIKTLRVFDREVQSSITFTYVAYDLGNPKLVSEKRVIVLNIEDENDNAPMWITNPSPYILEDYPINTQIFVMEASDNDIGQNAVINYYIKDNSMFQISSSGSVSLRKSLDRETKDIYNLTIFAHDNGDIPLENFITVPIKILDVNDNYPIFNEDGLHAEIQENVNGISDLVKLQATDQDIGSNAQILYSLQHDLFSIDSITGQVKVLRALDREEISQYNITVVARDEGNPSLHTEAFLIVDVLDMDDNCPVFTSSYYKETVLENLPYGTSILQVTATDKDIEVNADLNYGILESNDRGAFKIDSVSGWITVENSDKVDREFSEVYHLLIKAGSTSCGYTESDNVSEEGELKNNYTVANVYITVTDINDNAPIILNVEKKIYYENVLTTDIVVVNATDNDLGKGGEIEFSIIRIDQKVVSNQVQNHVIVGASDKGDKPLSSNATFIVINTIICDAMYFSITEVGLLKVSSLCSVQNQNSQSEIVVLVNNPVSLSCIAIGNSPVIYRWSKDGSVISGWSNEGNITLPSVNLDYEGSYVCIASSKPGVIQSSVTKLLIHEKPSILKQPTNVVVNERETAILTVKATAIPTPTYQWFKNDIPIKHAIKDEFVLESTTLADSATYFCNITNNQGQIQSEKVKINVINQESVVALNIKILKPIIKNMCIDFFSEDFEEQAKIILNRPLFVTNITNTDYITKLCNRTACSKNPCRNKGVCEITETGFQCVCTTSWQGQTCEENINECALDSYACYKGNCTDLEGSFSCACPQGMSGHRCQYNSNACQSNKCIEKNEVCVPSESNLFRCINKSNIMTLISKSITNWSLQTQYDLELSLNRIVKTMITSVPADRKRKRKDTSVVDFGHCIVHVTDHVLENDESKVFFILDCTISKSGNNKSAIFFSPNVVKGFCLQLLSSDDAFSQCGQLDGFMHKPVVPKMTPLNANVHVVIEDDNEKMLPADKAIQIMTENDFADRLEKYNYKVTSFWSAYDKPIQENKGRTLLIAISTFCAVVILAVVFVFVYQRRCLKTNDKNNQSSIMFQRSMMVHNASTSNLIPDYTSKTNKVFDEKNEVFIDDATFMSEVPTELISKKY
ncbi:cadherin-related tumor suppressor isoform X2 [Hydra vulgaris]|uniref:Hedgehog protein n=1 Tax=Hydra vulgaris TaxID=6087 RepID=A0ABM4C5N4_HYDVU